MADEREGAPQPPRDAGRGEDIQSPGRDANAAQPLDSAPDDGGPERYPSVRQDEAVERTGRVAQVTGETRSFDASADAPTPRTSSDDAGAAGARTDGFEGPQGDPVEGKR